MSSDRLEAEGPPPPDSVDHAINRVLLAERNARAEIVQRRDEAAQIISEAERRAARIGQRSEARIEAVHRVADRAVEEALHALLGPAPAFESDRASAQDHDRLERAVELLVEEMLGGR
ncbi:MAG: hypothetical protein WCA32_15145 [Chromatiaceae bacterium]